MILNHWRVHLIVEWLMLSGAIPEHYPVAIMGADMALLVQWISFQLIASWLTLRRRVTNGRPSGMLALPIQIPQALIHLPVMNRAQIRTTRTLHHLTVICQTLTRVPQALVVTHHQTQTLRIHLTMDIVIVTTAEGMDLVVDITIAVEDIDMIGSELLNQFLRLHMMERLMARNSTASQWK